MARVGRLITAGARTVQFGKFLRGSGRRDLWRRRASGLLCVCTEDCKRLVCGCVGVRGIEIEWNEVGKFCVGTRFNFGRRRRMEGRRDPWICTGRGTLSWATAVHTSRSALAALETVDNRFNFRSQCLCTTYIVVLGRA